MTDQDAPAPIGADGSAVVCQKCGTSAPIGTTNCPACGKFILYNQGNLRHGLRAYQTRGVLPADLKTDIDSFRANLISDQGGLEELSAIRAGMIRLLVDAEVGRRLMFREVVNRGVDSKPGRAAYDRLLSTMDRWTRIALALGLERRQADAMTIHDYAVEDGAETDTTTRTCAAGDAIAPDREDVDAGQPDALSEATAASAER